jgi:nucleotide-binding universal stress UspA family protein
MNDKKAILVTWDFTEVSENALIHAKRVAANVDNTIRLLHVAKDNGSIPQAEDKMKEEIKKLNSKYELDLEYVVLSGSIFREISNYAADHDELTMVVMGTHGIKGKQKYFGSYALRVIVGSPVPFVVVQDKPREEGRFRNILFPIDFKSENKEKLYWAIYMGKYFNAKVHLFKSPIGDKSLAKRVNTNLNFAIRFLIQNNLDYEIHTARTSKNFAREMINFGREIEADMIIVTSTKHITFMDYMFGAPEQFIMANASRIPVMVINPKASFAQVGQFMYGNS